MSNSAVWSLPEFRAVKISSLKLIATSVLGNFLPFGARVLDSLPILIEAHRPRRSNRDVALWPSRFAIFLRNQVRRQIGQGDLPNHGLWVPPAPNDRENKLRQVLDAWGTRDTVFCAGLETGA